MRRIISSTVLSAILLLLATGCSDKEKPTKSDVVIPSDRFRIKEEGAKK